MRIDEKLDLCINEIKKELDAAHREPHGHCEDRLIDALVAVCVALTAIADESRGA